jgi:SCP-2 sterol transfer family
VGRDLEPILLALGNWGMRVPLPPAPATLSATSVLLFLRSFARPGPEAPPATCRLELDDRLWIIRTEAGRLHVQPGEPASPDASLRADPATFNALLEGSRDLDAAVSDGSVVAAGDLSALRRLLQAVTTPAST